MKGVVSIKGLGIDVKIIPCTCWKVKEKICVFALLIIYIFSYKGTNSKRFQIYIQGEDSNMKEYSTVKVTCS